MKNMLNTFLINQEKHLDALLNLLPNSNFSDIVITNEQISNKIKDIINQINLNNTEFNNKIDSLIEKQETLKKESKTNYQTFLEKENKALQHKIKESYNNFNQKQNKTKQEFYKLQNEKKLSSKNIQAYFKKHKKDLLDLNNTLKQQHNDNKAPYLKRLENIYLNNEHDLKTINEYFTNLHNNFLRVNQKRILNQSEQVNSQQQKRNEFLELHKDDLVDARANFYKTINNVNKKINLIQSSYKELTTSTNDNYTNTKEKINKNIQDINQKTDTNNQNILTLFEEDLNIIDNTTERIRANYQTTKQNLKNKYDRMITSLNIKLYEQRELINEKINSIKENNSLLIKDKNKSLKANNKALKTLTKTNLKNTKKLTKNFNNDNKKLLKNYIKNIEYQRYLKRTKDKQKNLQILKNKRALYLYETYYLNRLKTYSQKKDTNHNIINTGLSLDIVPLNTITTLANYIYQTESSYYNQDQQDIKTNLTKQIDIIEQNSYLKELKLLRARDRNQLNNEAAITKNNLSYYFDMEKEKNKRRHEYNVYKHKTKINKSIYDISALRGKHKQEQLIERLNNKIEKLNNLLNLEKEKNTLTIDLYKENSSYISANKDRELQYRLLTFNIKNNIEQQKFKEKNILNTIHSYKNIIKEINISLKKNILILKNTNINNDKLITQNQSLLFKDTVLYLKNIITSTSNLVKSYFQDQLNNLNKQKYIQEQEKILNTYSKQLQKLEKALEDKEKQSKHYLKNQANLLNKIQLLTNDNNTHYNTINVISNKIHLNKGINKLLDKSLKLEIKSKNRRITKNNEAIKLHNLQTKQINKRIYLFESQIEKKQRQINKLNQLKNIKERKLKNKLNKEGYKFFNAIKIVNNLTTKLNNDLDYSISFYTSLLTTHFKNIKTFNKQYKKYFKIITKTNTTLDKYFFKLINETKIINNYQIANSQQELKQQQHNYIKASKHFYKEYLQNINYIKSNSKTLDTYINNTIRLFDKKLISSLQKVRTKQLQEINNLESTKTLLEKQLKKLNSDFNLFNKAFDLNRQDAINRENINLKNQLKELSKLNTKKQKQQLKQVAAAQDELAEFLIRRQLQLKYIAQIDKRNRKEVSIKNKEAIKEYKNQLSSLKRINPKLDKRNKRVKLRLNRNLKNNVKIITLKEAFTNLKEKIFLPFITNKNIKLALKEEKEE